MTDSSRRDFFRQLASDAARGAREVIPLVDPLAALVESSTEPEGQAQAPAPAPVEEERRRTEPATLASHSASVEEMLAIAAELDLGSRAEDLRRLAVSSVRLAPATDGDGGASFAGGEPTVPAAIEVPTFEDGEARFLALLDLPESGRLWIFQGEPGTGDTDPDEATDTATSEAAAVFEPAGDLASGEPIGRPPGATPLAASRELTLPRPWSVAVEALGLSPAEADSWQELRTRLAAAQGVPLGEGAPPRAAIHRIGGYPDERRGEMPLICELRLLGVDLEGRPPATHPLAAALEGETGNWRMLAQLAADDDLGWSWGPRYQRLYVWGHREDPASTGYDSVQVVVQ